MVAEKPEGPRLLAGGNPQIPKGGGDGPVRDYLDAHEHDEIDETPVRGWAGQASRPPGEKP